jgi:hypothetical protein
MRDFAIFNPPAEFPEEEEEDVEKIFAERFPYTPQTAVEIPTGAPDPP